jgi:hypothetical protein
MGEDPEEGKFRAVTRTMRRPREDLDDVKDRLFFGLL